MKHENANNFTLTANRVVDALFLKHPTRTIVGVCFGCFLYASHEMMPDLYAPLTFIDHDKVTLFNCVLLTVGLLYTLAYFYFLFKPALKDESLEEAIHGLRLLDQTGAPLVHKKQHAINVCQRLAARVGPLDKKEK